MSQSHLPNCHPDITRGWKPFKFPRTPLSDAITTSPVQDSEGHTYSGSVPPDWCATGGRRLAAHGGFLAAVVMTTARQYSRDKHENLRDVEPLNMSVEFLEPLPQGRFEVTLETLSTGNRGSVVQARIRSLELHEHKVCTVAMVRLGNLKNEGGVNSMQPSVWPLPNRMTECVRWSDATYYFLNPPSSTIRVYTPSDGEWPLWSQKFGGQNTRYQWTKLDDGGAFSLEHLPVLADLVPPITLNYAEEGMGASTRYRFPTTSMNIMFRSEVSSEEWLLTRTTMDRIHGGRFDMNIEILDEHGEIVASCTQLCSVIPVRRLDHKTEGRL